MKIKKSSMNYYNRINCIVLNIPVRLRSKISPNFLQKPCKKLYAMSLNAVTKKKNKCNRCSTTSPPSTFTNNARHLYQALVYVICKPALKIQPQSFAYLFSMVIFIILEQSIAENHKLIVFKKEIQKNNNHKKNIYKNLRCN